MGLFSRKKKTDNSGVFDKSSAEENISENIDESSEPQTFGNGQNDLASKMLKEEGKESSADMDDETAEVKKTKVYFKLDLRPQIVELPEEDDLTKINIKYDLIPPHVSCHIFWDDDNNELVYYVEEPKLNSLEKEVLRLVKLGLEEMINISFINAAKNKIVIQYLEHNVQSILAELGTKVSMEAYQKIMYYIYRDFIGINEIEPLLRDYYIEDIECNGVGSPIYVVHRKYRNLRTNILYHNMDDLTIFVEKLSQKCGRYISYAQPLLDGTLPDGSRINATYSQDVTTRGPTFTIRKFTKDPWMPTSLIKMGTASAEAFAFFWMAVEHKFNVITIGETGCGKTTFLNAVSSFIPDEARICSIEDTRELNLAHENWLPSVTREGFGVENITGEKYGEVTLFDLLKESFRQNPDYVIVGEVRDKETYVLFQGMASGHSCFSTFHAASIETLVKRLATPPISLPPSLIESMHIIAVMTHIKDSEKNLRRLKFVNEVIDIDDKGDPNYNDAFAYNPTEDRLVPSSNMYVLELIKKITGASTEDLRKELELRAKLLQTLADREITDFRDFSKVINTYYSEPKIVLEQYGINELSLKDTLSLKSDGSNAKSKEKVKVLRK